MDLPIELSERFHPNLVKKNPKGQDYVAIDGYINRLNDVLGAGWGWRINNIEWRHDVMPPTRNGQAQFLAIVHGTLVVSTNDIAVSSLDEDNDVLTSLRSVTSRDGVGAGVNYDPDTAVKTAQAEALKKACHQFGIALYLWDEEERDFIAKQRSAATDDIALKKLVMEYTIREKNLDPSETPTREQITECLGIEDLSVENMRSVLTERGVL
jgi:hypothetical protein